MKLILVGFLACIAARAETGHDAWLRYAKLDHPPTVPNSVTVLGANILEQSGRDEVVLGIKGMLGKTLTVETAAPKEGTILLGTLDEIRKAAPSIKLPASLGPDAFWLKYSAPNLVIAGGDERGVLYGSFALMRKIALGDDLKSLDEKQAPSVPARWVNEWDNLNGTIERGYGGPSIFWEQGHARADMTRVREYGRLLASLGINACAISNVNADPKILSPDFIPEIAKIADAFRPYGVHVALAVAFDSPKRIGGLDTFDPLDPKVIEWWKTTTDRIYQGIPDIAGFVLKADSEGRLGPSAYKRTHADAANVVARALKPHNGLFFYRGFVYDNHMDWNNLKNDRARAAWDNFHALDGQFDDNVVIQIKNGPIDFQVREPASPLFGALEKTSKAIELQITQEYNGQAHFLMDEVPMWKETLDFDMHAAAQPTPVKSLVRAFVGVSNVGMDENWLGNDMSQVNLYGFGRLAWNPDLSVKAITDEWTTQTFGSNPKVVDTIGAMQMSSWRTYEDFTGPLGLQTLTDITGNHYGVSVEASENNGWGQWHRADKEGVGMDRTSAGTGFTEQYHKPVAERFENLQTCPDDLLLFFHHVPYTYQLHSGKTVIQYIYDSHYLGADEVARYVEDWKTLKGLIDDDRYDAILKMLEYEAGQAVMWRDAVSNWFLRESGIPDTKGRVGHYPNRFEAESMKLDGYTEVAVKPWEAASGDGKAVQCNAPKCSAAMTYSGSPGTYDLHVRYFDQNTGKAKYSVLVNGKDVGDWTADVVVPSFRLDGSTSTRHIVSSVALKPGDSIEIEGAPDGREVAALDYLEIHPEGK
ncbi:MAG TPA: alpha-glucuronidase family glycosyl hydrolase [Bryobacteraceae bacterium]|nr:alpha-glucuronidase family glycosyl hydrolase [Bryobacteraceae bacterium]